MDAMKYCVKCGAQLTSSEDIERGVCAGCAVVDTQVPSIEAPVTENAVFAPPAAEAEDYSLFSAFAAMFKKYAKFSGRSRRKEFWLAYLMTGIIAVVPALLGGIFTAVGTANESELSALIGILLIFAVSLFGIAVIIPQLALSVRRLHDIGKSGWWYLLSFVPYVGGIVLLVFSCLDSQPGENKWGPNPKGK